MKQCASRHIIAACSALVAICGGFDEAAHLHKSLAIDLHGLESMLECMKLIHAHIVPGCVMPSVMRATLTLWSFMSVIQH